MNRPLCVAAVILSLAACAFAQQYQGKELVKIQFVADVSAIQPGQPFHVGIHLKIEPEWHVYWKNPGETGMATKLDLKLPDGFKADPVQFPTPARHTDPFGIHFNGYDGEVMLITKITPPANLAAGKSVKIEGKASWLVCARTCIPGSAPVLLELPVADKATPANSELFSKWNERLPKDSGLGVKQSAGSIEVTFTDAPQKVEWFFDPGENMAVEDVDVSTRGSVSKATFKLERQGRNPPPDDIEVVVAYTNKDGNRVGHVIRHPIPKSVGVNR